MLYIVLTFLFLSVLFYLIFGGADFGVGVMEFFSSNKNKSITKTTAYRVIGTSMGSESYLVNHMYCDYVDCFSELL